MLFLAWCDLAPLTTANGKSTKGLHLLALTSYGRLFAIKGRSVKASCHAVHVASALNTTDALQLSFVEPFGPAWHITSTPKAIGQLQVMLWVCSSTANAAVLMCAWRIPDTACAGRMHTGDIRVHTHDHDHDHAWTCMLVVTPCVRVARRRRTNMAKPPLELLPPLAIDGNLHTSFVMQANAVSMLMHMAHARAHGPCAWQTAAGGDARA